MATTCLPRFQKASLSLSSNGTGRRWVSKLLFLLRPTIVILVKRRKKAAAAATAKVAMIRSGQMFRSAQLS